ncbi:MAG: TolC family protein [Burkholderiales bacterium]
MHINARSTRIPHWPRRVWLAAAAACALSTQAQVTAPDTTRAPAAAFSLKHAFDAAWSRQPEALALPLRREAARADQQAAQAWTPAAAALEISEKSDRLNRNRGARELEIGVVVPLWLPDERSRSNNLASAQVAAVDSRATAAQLRVSGILRQLWWQWQRDRVDADMARDQLASAQRIAADVSRRRQAGDLALADQHQADGAVAVAESALAQAQARVVASLQQLTAHTGGEPIALHPTMSAAEPAPDDSQADIDGHGSVLALKDQATVAERTASLATAQSRAHPELLLATTRERAAFGETNQQTITLGVRFPFGDGARHEARIATALADAAEARAQLALERQRVLSEREAHRSQVAAARVQLAAAERRERLARESRGFVDKSFRLGETDLPTRLRIEAEAADAERQAARGRVDLAAAISAWRQSLGLLP